MKWAGLVLVALLWAPSARAEKVIVPGDPPLTDVTIVKEQAFFEWLFETQLTAEQHRRLEEELVNAWKNKDAKQIRTATDNLRNYDDMEKMSPDERDMMRTQVQPQLIKELHRDKDPLNQWGVGVYESAHKALVAGKPPLTRQVTDAYAELVAFVLSETVGGEPYEPGRAFSDAVAKAVTSEWRRLKPAEKASLAATPMLWAAARATWPTLAAAEKDKFKTAWKTAVASWEPKAGWMPPAPKIEPASGTASADGGATVPAVAKAQGEAGRWAEHLATLPRVINQALIANLTAAGWKYEVKPL